MKTFLAFSLSLVVIQVAGLIDIVIWFSGIFFLATIASWLEI
jgi:hypothetical protein